MTSRRLLDPVQKVLLDAADNIEFNGWFRLGRCMDRTPGPDPACALVAIGRASVGDDRLFSAAARHLSEHVGWLSIDQWNDHPARTKDEVMATLREAAIQYQPSFA